MTTPPLCLPSAVWSPWIGLPSRWGADPRKDGAACCFRLTEIVRTILNLPWPHERMEGWYHLARGGQWSALHFDYGFLTTPAEDRLPGSFRRIASPGAPVNGAFGLGVIVDERYMLTVLEGRGMVAVPRSAWRRWQFEDYRR